MKPPAKEKARVGLPCPICRKEAELSWHDYGERHDCYACGMRGWNGKELVTLKTLKGRKLAHDTFDLIWKKYKIYPRYKAYFVLADEMGLDRGTCHMAEMSRRECDLVIQISNKIIKDYKKKQKAKKKLTKK